MGQSRAASIIETGGQPVMVRKPVKLELKSGQVEYLRRVASREDASLSKALACIIETYAGPTTSDPRRPTCKVRTHVSINSQHLSLLDHLATKWGLSRSDVVRRLVDSAQANDPWIGSDVMATAQL